MKKNKTQASQNTNSIEQKHQTKKFNLFSIVNANKTRLFFVLLLIGIFTLTITKLNIPLPFLKGTISGVVYGLDDIHTVSGIEVVLNDGQQITTTDSDGFFFFFTNSIGKQKVTIQADMYEPITVFFKPSLKEVMIEDYYDISLQVNNSLLSGELFIAEKLHSSSSGDLKVVILTKDGKELVNITGGANPVLIDNKTIQYETGGSLYNVYLDGTGVELIGNIPDTPKEEPDTYYEDISYDNKYKISSSEVIKVSSEETVYSIPTARNIWTYLSWFDETHKLVIVQCNCNGDRKTDIYIKDIDNNDEPKKIGTIAGTSFSFSSRDHIKSPSKTRFVSDNFLFDINSSNPVPLPENSNLIFLPNDDFILSVPHHSDSEIEEGTHIFSKSGSMVKKISDNYLTMSELEYSLNPNDQQELLFFDGTDVFIYNIETQEINKLSFDGSSYNDIKWLTL